MVSQTTEYAIRAVVMLAHLQAKGPVDNRTLAEKSQVPVSYLPKILQCLGRAGLVQSRRGAGGGSVLARSPDQITILDVVNAVEPIPRIKGCPLGLKTHCRVLCPMHARLDKAMAEVESVLGASTVAELLADSSRPLPMMETAGFD
jgi:Rrf2 family protein